MKIDLSNLETVDHIRDRLMQLASGHELMGAVDPDTPGACYLHDKYRGDVGFIMDVCDAFLAVRSPTVKPTRASRKRPASKGRNRANGRAESHGAATI